jgi:hypothetical protein
VSTGAGLLKRQGYDRIPAQRGFQMGPPRFPSRQRPAFARLAFVRGSIACSGCYVRAIRHAFFSAGKRGKG